MLIRGKPHGTQRVGVWPCGAVAEAARAWSGDLGFAVPGFGGRKARNKIHLEYSAIRSSGNLAYRQILAERLILNFLIDREQQPSDGTATGPSA